ncbi:MAG: molybdopterin molybdotransferase MoeA [Alphaproteobacteria bacterium]
MINFDEAVEIVRSAASPLATETVPLADAAGRVLAAPVVARIDSPRADVSAMDGYAVREADLLDLPARLAIAGESFAGRGWTGEVCPGQCARIFTGAPVPKGADRVVIQENVRREGDVAIIDQPPGKALHIRRRGGDFAVGELLLEPGRRLDPRAVTAAAAADLDRLEVFRRPRVHILATGDELAEPGTASGSPDAIAESVSFGIAALAADWGARVTGRTRLRDDLPAMERAAAGAAQAADLIIVTGGASVGEKDFAKAMFETAGLELLFSKVAIKPGKPVWLGHAGEALVLGLPGNPTSALVTGRLLLAPLLCGLTGRGIGEALRWRGVPLATPLDPCGPRETFHRARLCDGAAQVLSNQDSSAQKALAEADLLVRQLGNAPAKHDGELVDVLDF